MGVYYNPGFWGIVVGAAATTKLWQVSMSWHISGSFQLATVSNYYRNFDSFYCSCKYVPTSQGQPNGLRFNPAITKH